MYLHRETEPGCWTVGFYDPNGNWESVSDHDTEVQAAEKVKDLNGSDVRLRVESARINKLERRVDELEEFRFRMIRATK